MLAYEQCGKMETPHFTKVHSELNIAHTTGGNYEGNSSRSNFCKQKHMARGSHQLPPGDVSEKWGVIES